MTALLIYCIACWVFAVLAIAHATTTPGAMDWRYALFMLAFAPVTAPLMLASYLVRLLP